jgi:hypothetical protein
MDKYSLEKINKCFIDKFVVPLPDYEHRFGWWDPFQPLVLLLLLELFDRADERANCRAGNERYSRLKRIPTGRSFFLRLKDAMDDDNLPRASFVAGPGVGYYQQETSWRTKAGEIR